MRDILIIKIIKHAKEENNIDFFLPIEFIFLTAIFRNIVLFSVSKNNKMR